MSNRPEGHVPRFEALSAMFDADEEIVFSQYGVQSTEHARAAEVSECAS